MLLEDVLAKKYLVIMDFEVFTGGDEGQGHNGFEANKIILGGIALELFRLWVVMCSRAGECIALLQTIKVVEAKQAFDFILLLLDNFINE